jgi:hypothetical protein
MERTFSQYSAPPTSHGCLHFDLFVVNLKDSLGSLPTVSELEVGRSKLELFAFYKSVSGFKITVVLVVPKDPLKALINLCFSI